MNKSSMPKYLKSIVSQVVFKTKHVNKPSNEQQSTEVQLYNDEILEIYKAAFAELINNLVTFSSILTDIKKAYENSLKSRDDRISELITKDRIYGISVRKQQRDETVERLLKENEELRELHCKSTRELYRVKTEMGKLKDSQTFDYLSVARERDARYALYAENVQLWLKVRALDGSDELRHGVGDEDPVVMRIALERCREQLSSVQQELVVTRAEYAESVPRAECDALEAARGALARRLLALQEEHEALQEQFRRCAASKKSLEEELSETRSRCSELERCGTPRPEWGICGEFIGGGSDRWRQLASELSSRERLRVLLKELGPAAESENLEFFDGLGTDPSIPPFLRWEGRLRDLRLSRRQLGVVIADVWASKRDHRHVPLAQYLTAYFEERYQQPSVRAQWAYSVCAAAEQALDDLQVKLFWGALHSVLSERVYWGLRAHWDSLREALYARARPCPCPGQWITMEQFQKVAKETFSLKSEVDIRNLADVVKKQLKLTLNNNQVNLEKLFQEPAEGFERCELAQELYRQRRAAQQRYLRELEAELRPRGGRPTGRADTPVSVDALKRAFAVVDPAIDHIRMERHLRWAFSLGAEQPLHTAPPLPLRALLARLHAGDIERAGPRAKPGHRRLHHK